MQPKSRPPATRGNLAIYGAEIAVDPVNFALDYAAQGYSVIPLFGDSDPDRAKQPAIPWTPSQYHPADQQQLYEWFGNGRYNAIGIVTGKVSRLAVLDFDDPAKAAAFRSQYPLLADTREIISGGRSLPHFYYELPDELLNVPTRHIDGVGDFQANGAYVVAYPTTIDGGKWQLVNDVPPHVLRKHEHAVIMRFMGVIDKPVQLDGSAPLVMLPKPVSGDELTTAYETLRQTTGRNRSAFDTARKYARPAGWTIDDTIAALAAVFIADPPPPGHRRQSESARYNELTKTVESAFGKDYNPATGEYVAVNGGLPNSVREYLLKQPKVKGQAQPANHARVLDMLFMTGLQPGQRFTEKAAVDCGVSCGIGHLTIRAALNWLEEIQPSITLLRSGDNVADAPIASLPIQEKSGIKLSNLPIYTYANDITMLCMWQIQEFNQKRGRPTKTYTLPDVTDLCTVLNVEITACDKLELADLKSAKAYRVGMQRALVARRENQPMSRKWAAERLGISVRTVYSYDEPAGIEPIINELVTPISWQNVKMIPIDSSEAGYGFYLRVDGINRPPRKKIATDALAAKQTLEYVQRRANKYKLKAKPEAVQDDPLLSLGRELGAVIEPVKKGKKHPSMPVHISKSPSILEVSRNRKKEHKQ